MRRSARRPGRTSLALLVAAVIAIVGAGCDRVSPEPPPTSPEASHEAQKTGSGERRTDIGPLTDRFAALESPARATWYSGTLGRGEAPGPSSYWIDAVVQLSDAQTEDLVQRYGPESTAERPVVVDDLSSDVPSAPLVANDELDRAFSTAGFASRVWLDPENGRLVLSAVGQ